MPIANSHTSDNQGQSFNYDHGFGGALSMLRAGHRMMRRGWNGKGMFIYLVPANRYPAQTEIAKQSFGETVSYREYIAFKTVDNDVVPWVASQTDLLADDWFIVEEL